ncbi:MAG: porphobilinogen synthase [Proteobacteria bacterium]|nr:porphobilinogen synthase [Pseudomonadota bacterium]
MRRLFRECSLESRHLIQPYFVVEGKGTRREVRPGYGLWQLSADMLQEEIQLLEDKGVGGLMLFAVPSFKCEDGSALAKQMAPTQKAIELCKKWAPHLPVFVDTCLCSFLSHGHCGLVRDGKIDNDSSVACLADMAVGWGKAGADFVSPSDMMDGRVLALREALDEADLEAVAILSYAVKMQSAFYGPFRDAANSAPEFGDRSSYQEPVANRREALREIELDVLEGADALLIKPALSNLDLIRDARETCELPLVAYQVSGEFAMLRAAADAGLLEFEAACKEALLSMRRAGADFMVSYAARTIKP